MIGERSRVLLLLAGLFLGLAAQAVAARALEVRGFTLTVANLDQSVAFYEQALGFAKVSERVVADRNRDYLMGVFGTRVGIATLRLGSETIQLEQYLSPAGRPIPGDSRSNDLWFQHFAVVVSDMEKAYAQLQRVPHQAISSAPQTIPESNKAAAGIKAFKFKDPDGRPLELLYFPPGKGRAKWQARGDRLFLGIDHSAIAVSSTERSAAFYRDLLGLSVAGEGLNSGPTQEQLDNAFGAVVRITGLRPDSTDGPGLEFLQYLTPACGRPAPGDGRPNDVAHMRTVLEVDNLDQLATRMSEKGVAFISPQTTDLGDTSHRRGLMVKDPDGHAVMLVEH